MLWLWRLKWSVMLVKNSNCVYQLELDLWFDFSLEPIFWYCPCCLKKYYSLQKWSKVTHKINHIASFTKVMSKSLVHTVCKFEEMACYIFVSFFASDVNNIFLVWLFCCCLDLLRDLQSHHRCSTFYVLFHQTQFPSSRYESSMLSTGLVWTSNSFKLQHSILSM